MKDCPESTSPAELNSNQASCASSGRGYPRSRSQPLRKEHKAGSHREQSHLCFDKDSFLSLSFSISPFFSIVHFAGR